MIIHKVSNKKKWRRIFIISGAMVFLVTYLITLSKLNSHVKKSDKFSDMLVVTGTVEDVIDEKSICVRVGEELEKVELLDTAVPLEMKDKAVEYLKEELKGKVVELHYYENEYADEINKYGRMAAYMYFKHMLMNGTLIERGLAVAMGASDLKNNDSVKPILLELEEKAKSKGIGIWKNTKDKTSLAFDEGLNKAKNSLQDAINTSTKEQSNITNSLINDVKNGLNSITNMFKGVKLN